MASTSLGYISKYIDAWRTISRFKWLILSLVVTSTVVTGIVSKFAPKYYRAESSLYPVREDSLGGGGLSFGSSGGGGSKDKGGGGGGASFMMDAMGGRGPSLLDTLQVLLESRLMGETIIDQLDLMQYYGTKSKVDAVGTLRGESEFKTNKFKALFVKVETRDPKVAADIANAYFKNLDRLYREYTINSTKRNIAFIEGRLAEKAKKLAEAENALKQFQTENRIIGAGEQAEGAMGAAAQLHGEIVSLEVELAALREYALPSHPMINQLTVRIQELQKQLDKLEQDQAQGIKQRRRAPLSKKVFPLYEEAPSLALEMIRLNRQLKVEEAVYGMLVGMLEQAKIAVSKDLPTIQVLDAAIPPERPLKSKTMQNVAVAFVLSLVLGLMLAFFLEAWERMQAEQLTVGPRSGDESDAPENGGNGDKGAVIPAFPKTSERLHG